VNIGTHKYGESIPTTQRASEYSRVIAVLETKNPSGDARVLGVIGHDG